MAYILAEPMTKGHQLTELKLACETNMQQIVTHTSLADHVILGSGMGLTKFRGVMNLNIDAMNTEFSRNYPLIGSGDSVRVCREKLRLIFENIAVFTPAP